MNAVNEYEFLLAETATLRAEVERLRADNESDQRLRLAALAFVEEYEVRGHYHRTTYEALREALNPTKKYEH